MLRERGDELIDRYCSAIQNAERTAINAVKKQREETARARDQRSNLAGTLARILLDAIDHGEDPVSRTLQEVGEQGYGQHKPKRCNRAVDRPESPLFVDEE